MSISLSGIMNLHEFVVFVMFECDMSLNHLPPLIMKKKGLKTMSVSCQKMVFFYLGKSAFFHKKGSFSV